MAEERRSGGVQSIARTFTLLELVAANGGVMGLSQLAQESGFPLPTIHRLVRTLVDLGYLRQEPSRRYALGPRLLLLADSSETMLNHVAVPHLRRVVESVGETTNLAMLDGDQVAYVAQAPGSHSMRMFTEVGRRVSPHCTAVGKALLGEASDVAIRDLLGRGGMEQNTPNTITDPEMFLAQVKECRDRGYALDEGEQEVGVRCVAVVVPSTSTRLAVSVSGPVPRMSDDLVRSAVPVLTEAAAALAAELG